jgi:hypothetical protein
MTSLVDALEHYRWLVVLDLGAFTNKAKKRKIAFLVIINAMKSMPKLHVMHLAVLPHCWFMPWRNKCQ